MAKKQKEVMLTKNEIEAAISESQEVKKNYPAFWKFYEMLLELNNGLTYLEASMKKDKGRK
jgi:hypothetical protein